MPDLTSTTAATWIPKQWSDEVQVAYESNKPIVERVKFEKFGIGKVPGDVLHFPLVSNLTASDITDNSDIEGQAPTESEVTVTLNKKKHSSLYIQKHLANNLSKYDFRKLYTEKVGEALARQMQLDLIVTLLTATSASVGTTGSSATNVTDTYVRLAMSELDLLNAPLTERTFVFYPDQKSAILGIDRFSIPSNIGQYGEMSPVQTGRVINLYNQEVHFTTDATTNGTTPDFYRSGMYFHKEVVVLAAPEIGPDVTYDWVPRRKAWLLSGDVFYGSALYRAANGLIVYTDSAS